VEDTKVVVHGLTGTGGFLGNSILDSYTPIAYLGALFAGLHQSSGGTGPTHVGSLLLYHSRICHLGQKGLYKFGHPFHCAHGKGQGGMSVS